MFIAFVAFINVFAFANVGNMISNLPLRCWDQEDFKLTACVPLEVSFIHCRLQMVLVYDCHTLKYPSDRYDSGSQR